MTQITDVFFSASKWKDISSLNPKSKKVICPHTILPSEQFDGIYGHLEF